MAYQLNPPWETRGVFDSADRAWESAIQYFSVYAGSIARHGWDTNQLRYCVELNDGATFCYEVCRMPMNKYASPKHAPLMPLDPARFASVGRVDPIEFPMSAERARQLAMIRNALQN